MKRATDRGAHTEHVEKPRRDRYTANLLRSHIMSTSASDREEPISPPNHVVESTTSTTPVDEITGRIRHRVSGSQMELGIDVVDPVEAFRMIERWRPQHQTIRDAE